MTNPIEPYETALRTLADAYHWKIAEARIAEIAPLYKATIDDCRMLYATDLHAFPPAIAYNPAP